MRNLVFVFLTVATVAVGLWLDKATDTTAIVTSVYVVLVYFQLQIMNKQHLAAEQERKNIAAQAASQLPKLDFPNPTVRLTIETDSVRKVELGSAWYVNCYIRNTGGSIAKSVQPVLSAFATKLPNGQWRPVLDWIPLGLRWALDELNVFRGEPTQDRYLVPHRPYMFDLGKVSTYLVNPKFELLSLIKPAAQPDSFGAGQYCCEVTAYAENAPPTRCWYIVSAHDLGSHNPITVEQVHMAPWLSMDGATLGNRLMS